QGQCVARLSAVLEELPVALEPLARQSGNGLDRGERFTRPDVDFHDFHEPHHRRHQPARPNRISLAPPRIDFVRVAVIGRPNLSDSDDWNLQEVANQNGQYMMCRPTRPATGCSKAPGTVPTTVKPSRL